MTELTRLDWHIDYLPGANAYTLLTPLFHRETAHGHLLYRDKDKTKKRHAYRPNEALIVGDYFSHATEPYPKSAEPRVLLSLTFGTDKFDHWPALKQTIDSQSEFFILPCGHESGTCHCLEEFGVAAATSSSEDIYRTTGRNEPCPCGSGKRFKHCHGRI